MLASGGTDQKGKDKSSLTILWITIILSITFANLLRYSFNFPISRSVSICYIGLSLIALSIGLRYLIIKNLGSYFTVDVTIKKDHQIKKDGFYSIIRHPSYAASLLTFLGFGLYLNNWISLIIAIVPVFLAFSYRIKVEENALIERFKDDYLDYRKQTKRLIPFIY